MCILVAFQIVKMHAGLNEKKTFSIVSKVCQRYFIEARRSDSKQEKITLNHSLVDIKFSVAQFYFEKKSRNKWSKTEFKNEKVNIILVHYKLTNLQLSFAVYILLILIKENENEVNFQSCVFVFTCFCSSFMTVNYKEDKNNSYNHFCNWHSNKKETNNNNCNMYNILNRWSWHSPKKKSSRECKEN